MSDPDLDRLFGAWAESLSRSQPALNPGVRSRVLAQHPQSGAPRAFPPYRWALSGFAVAVALAVMLILRAPSALTFQAAGRTGEVGAWLSAQPTQELALNFSEGTRVSLSKGSRGRVTRVTHSGAHMELADGSVEAEVTHAPGAAWSFGAGPFEVTVTGTKLGVSWAPDTGRFELSVSRGSVLVKGPFISQQQEVRAGQVCRVDLNHHLMELGQLVDEAVHPAQTTLSAAPQPSTAPQPSAVPKTVGSAALPPTTSSASHPLSAQSLLDEARAARMSGRPDLERAALLACRKRAPGQPAAAQAAYLLGRASAAGEASAWFEAYLREMPQGLLAREAAGRLIESYQAAGNPAAAQSAASRYLARYPNGPHAAMARQALAAH